MSKPDRQPTEFQRKVWKEVQGIGWGETRTFGEVAEAVGRDQGGALAVGEALRALNRHPDMNAIVPWWRVTRKDRKLPIDKEKGGTSHRASRVQRQARRLLLEGHRVEKRGDQYVVRSRVSCVRDALDRLEAVLQDG